MIITMSSYTLKDLTRRIEENLERGFELVTKVKKVVTKDKSYYRYENRHGGKWVCYDSVYRTTWQVAMKKVSDI
jgi:hypothetical protein